MIDLRRMSRMLFVVAALCATSSMCRTAFAEDDSDEVASYAIQRRLFRQGLELNASIGVLPFNAFDKGIVGAGTVTWHISSTWAWEIGQGAYAFVQADTGLKNQLLNNFNVQPTSISIPQFLVSTNMVFTPFYGKVAGLNHSVSHIELFFPFGLALGRYENPAQYEEGVDLGIGLRWYLTPAVSLRADIRDFLLTDSITNFSLKNELLCGLGVSFSFGGAER